MPCMWTCQFCVAELQYYWSEWLKLISSRPKSCNYYSSVWDQAAWNDVKGWFQPWTICLTPLLYVIRSCSCGPYVRTVTCICHHKDKMIVRASGVYCFFLIGCTIHRDLAQRINPGEWTEKTGFHFEVSDIYLYQALQPAFICNSKLQSAPLQSMLIVVLFC